MNALQHTATHCNTLLYAVYTLAHTQYVHTHIESHHILDEAALVTFNQTAQQRTATHGNTLQHTEIYSNTHHILDEAALGTFDQTALQHTATHYNALQHTPHS